MVGGQQDKLRVGAIIQARMGSQRLPGKILMPMPYPNGRPLLSRILLAAKKTSLIDEVIIATSIGPENDILESFAKREQVNIIRGSENDVLDRFLLACDKSSFDIIVRLTGDNPILDSGIMDEVVAAHIENMDDYTYSSGLPIGMNIEVISVPALRKLPDFELTSDDREHVTLFFRRSANFKSRTINFDADELVSTARLTVDYPSDFAALSTILSCFGENETPGLQDLTKLFTENPWLLKINSENPQNLSFGEASLQIRWAVTHLERYGMDKAAEILKEKLEK
jgi:spore coat polysaccharide biosynthesis protein SpsF